MVSFQWNFPEMPPSMPNQEPMEREFFVDETLNTRLVRESIQNSLDAGRDRHDRRKNQATIPVKVRFSLAGIQNPLQADEAERYFRGLDQHLGATETSDVEIRRRLLNGNLVQDGVPFIVIEDSGTIGLTGDWEQYDDLGTASARTNHFYWFFRNVGRSAKSGTENGSWGLGKWVFPDASHAGCYLAVTRRKDDTLLFGQAVLSKHSIDGHRFAPYGYLSVEGANGLALPLRQSEPGHRELVDRCITDFGLKFRDDTGLSIVIPFPKTEHAEEHEALDARYLLTAVIHNYFYPIVAGWLEVIIDPGDGEQEVAVTAETIDQIVSNLGLHDEGERSEEGYRHLFDLCREALELQDNGYTWLSKPPGNDKSSSDSREVIRLRNRYERGDLLAFKVGTDVQGRNEGRSGSSEKTQFHVYLQRDDSLDAGHDFYVRGTLSITEMDLIGKRRARSLLVVDENEPLAAMLRDSEPPKHTAWRPQTERASKNWVSAKRKIDEVRRTPNNLLSLLEAPPEGLQRDVFADIFPWNEESGAGRRRRRGSSATRDGIDHPGWPTDPVPPDFSIARSATGFRANAAPNAASPLEAGQNVRIRVAYEVSRGNPLNSYQEEDFRLQEPNGLEVLIKGADVRIGDEGNRLDLVVSNPEEFLVEVQGFDQRRDLHIRIEKTANETGEATDNANDA